VASDGFLGLVGARAWRVHRGAQGADEPGRFATDVGGGAAAGAKAGWARAA